MLLFVALISGYAIAMEPETKTHLLVIDGCCWHNKSDHISSYVCKMFPYFKQHIPSIHHATTPYTIFDFGQNQCQSYIEKQINLCKKENKLHDNDPLIVYGSSEGTATTINYVAKNPKNIKALILETVMLTGNSTIQYAFLGDTISLPSAGLCLLSYIAQLKFPHYSPAGEQAINNIDVLPNDVPIIILHDINNRDFPCKNAQALYAYLTKICNNKSVYLFTQENEIHLNLSSPDDKNRIHAINSILALHKVLPYNFKKECLTIDQLKKYQPEVSQEWLNYFNTLANKEQQLKSIGNPTKIAITPIIITLYILNVLGKIIGIIKN